MRRCSAVALRLGGGGVCVFVRPPLPPSAPERTLQASGQGQAIARPQGRSTLLLRACTIYALGGEWREPATEEKLCVPARECSSYRIECRGIFEHKQQKMAVIPMLRVEAWVLLPNALKCLACSIVVLEESS